MWKGCSTNAHPRRLGILQCLDCFFLRSFRHRFDQTAFARHLPGDLPCQRHDLGSLRHAGAACIRVNLLLLPVQQFRSLREVRPIRRREHDRMHPLAVPIRAAVRFHSASPLVALGGAAWRQARLLPPEQGGPSRAGPGCRSGRLRGLRRPGHTIAGGNKSSTCAPTRGTGGRVRLWDRTVE